MLGRWHRPGTKHSRFPGEALSTGANRKVGQAISGRRPQGRQPDATLLQAFAEYFTQVQLTNLVLTAMECLTDSKAKVSLAAAQLMSAVMKERGRDMIKVAWGYGGSSDQHTRLGSPLALSLASQRVLGSPSPLEALIHSLLKCRLGGRLGSSVS